MKHAFILLNCLLLGIFGCQPKEHSSTDIPVINVRTAMEKVNPISLKSDVESIEYIALETNDSCLVSKILNLQMSQELIFINNGKTGQILQFNRKGGFIRQIAREGNGLGGDYQSAGSIRPFYNKYRTFEVACAEAKFTWIMPSHAKRLILMNI